MGQVIVFGSMNMDLTVECDEMPRAGETVEGYGFFANAGGKGANQAVAAAHMGAETRMIAAVGRDTFGDELTSQLSGYGVTCTDVCHMAGRATGTATIIRTNGDNRIILGAGANHALGATDVSKVLDEVAKAGDVFLTQFECDLETTFAAIRDAHERGLYTIVNPAPAHDLPEGLLGYIDLVCVNETECESICGILPTDDETCLSASGSLMASGASTVVITLGSHGAFARDSSQALVMPALAGDVVDTTCAGDTFLGSLAASHLAGIDLAEAMGRATCASSLAVSRLGAQRSIPSLDEVERLYEKSHPQPRVLCR